MGIDLIKNEEEVYIRLEITDEMKENLLEATKWIRFMNIVGCISMGLLAFVGLMFFFNGIMDSYHNGINSYIGLVYIALAAIYYPVLKKVFAFVSQARSACKYDDCEKLAGMFDSLRYVAKYSGIICAVILGIYAVAIIVGVFAAIFS